MEHRPNPLTRFPRSTAFTLLELLMVVSIMALLYVLALPAFNSMLTSYRLSSAANLAVGVLDYARHSSVALDHTVEVRFYRYAISGLPGEQPGNPSTGKYRAIQLFQYNGSGSAVPLTKAQPLPDGIIFDSGTLSSLLSGTSTLKTFTPPLDSQISIPQASSYLCSAYQIYPGCTTTLPLGQWFVTLHRLTDGDGLSVPPHNFATIQVDPVSATVRSYKP